MMINRNRNCNSNATMATITAFLFLLAAPNEFFCNAFSTPSSASSASITTRTSTVTSGTSTTSSITHTTSLFSASPLSNAMPDIPQHRALANGKVDPSKFYRQRPVQPDGSYPCRPLEKPNTRLAVIQTDCEGATADGVDREQIMQRNLQNMIDWAEKACQDPDNKPDILLFHEFPLTGGLVGPGWDRSKQLDWAIEVPGSFTERLAQVAKKHDVYLIFGAYAKDPVHWPGHILSIQTVIGRNGDIVQQIWKPKNIKRFYGSFEITTTTVESVRSRFQQLYGMDSEFPVVQTEFGNIAVSTVQLDPFVYSAFAMRGAELMLRTSTLFFREDVVSMALSNQMYSAMANIPYPDSPEHGGHSMIVNPHGKIVAELQSESEEGYIIADIPMAEFRQGRRLPQYSLDLTREIFAHYQEEIPSDHMDMPSDDLPQNGREMKVLLDDQSQWLNTPQKTMS